jgi:hypothetical protein
VPYVPRNVHVESRQLLVEGAAVQERHFEYHQTTREDV